MHCTCCSDIYNDTVERLKTFLLHNEMDVLFRIAAHPDVHMEARWILSPWSEEYGRSAIVRSALMAYVCLNVFFLKPEPTSLYSLSTSCGGLGLCLVVLQGTTSKCIHGDPIPAALDCGSRRREDFCHHGIKTKARTQNVPSLKDPKGEGEVRIHYEVGGCALPIDK